MGISSAALLVIGSSALSAGQFGEYGLVYSIAAACLVIWRSGVLARLTLIPSKTELVQRILVTRRLAALSSPVIFAAFGLLSLGMLGSTVLRGSFLLLMCSLPLLIVFDLLRQALIALDAHTPTLIVGSFWAAGAACAVGVSATTTSIEAALLLWLLSGLIGVLVLWTYTTKKIADIQGAGAIGDSDLPSLWHFNIVSTLQVVVSVCVAVIAYFVGSPALLSIVVVANAAMYPVSVYTQAVPLLYRKINENSRRPTLVAGVAAVVLSAAWLVAVVTLLQPVTGFLFGDTWRLAENVVWLAAINLTGGALVAVAIAALHVQRRQRITRRVVVSVSILRLPVALVVVSETESAAWLLIAEISVQLALASVLLVVQSHKVTRR